MERKGKINKIIMIAIMSGVLVAQAKEGGEFNSIDIRELNKRYGVQGERAGTGIKYIDEILQIKEATDVILVGIVNIEGGFNEFKGEELGIKSKYKKGLWHEKRGAFYLKGTILGKYITEISYDSDREETDVFGKIDPNKSYPVYGDSSEIDTSSVETRGKLYVMIKEGENEYKWGQFKVGYNETEIGRFNKELYGFKGRYETKSKKTRIKGFDSRIKEKAGVSIFKVTGGSIYYTREKELVYGSVRVEIVKKDKETGQEEARVEIKEGEDYEVDYEVGRISIEKEIVVIGEKKYKVIEGIEIREEEELYIEVGYNYETVGGYDEGVRGIRVEQEIGTGIRLGYEVVRESKEKGKYKLDVGDIKINNKYGEYSYEQGRSVSSVGEKYISSDGGLSFGEDKGKEKKAGSNRAKVFKGKFEIGGLKNKVYYEDIGGRYSSEGIGEQGKRSYGIEISKEIDKNKRVIVGLDISRQDKYNKGEKEAEENKSQGRIEYRYKGEGYEINVGYKREETEGKTSKGVQKKKEDIVGVRIDKGLAEGVQGHLQYQYKSKGEKNKHIVGAGIKKEINKYIGIEGKVFTSDEGVTGIVSVIGQGEYKINDKMKIKGRAKVSSNGEVEYGIGSQEQGEYRINEQIKIKGGYGTSIEQGGNKAEAEVGIEGDYKIQEGREIKIVAKQKKGKGSEGINTVMVRGKETIGGGYEAIVGSEYSGSKGKYKMGSYVGMSRNKQGRYSEIKYSKGQEKDGDRVETDKIKLRDSYEVMEGLKIKSGLEYRRSREAKGRGIGYGYGMGIEYGIGRYEWTGKYERDYSTDKAGDRVQRHIIGLGVKYETRKLDAGVKIEYRRDKGTEQVKQYRVKGEVKTKIKREQELYGKIDMVRTDKANQDKDYRIDIGYSYRGIKTDKVNLLSKLTWFERDNQGRDWRENWKEGKEKGYVLGVDMIYEINKQFDWEQKIAYRRSEEGRILTEGEIKSEYWLIGSGIGYKYDKETTVKIGYNKLKHQQNKDSREGYMISLVKRIDSQIEIEGGYKYRDVVEDLADLGYQTKGFFMRVSFVF